jgi:patatin-like phospholipase/acyl hydrolase
MNGEPREVPIRDPSKIIEMVKNLQQTGVISNVTEDWLMFKADNTQRCVLLASVLDRRYHKASFRYHMQMALQDLADFMHKDEAKKAKDPQSWSTIAFEQNDPSDIFRFITEISQRDRELLHQFLAGCRRMNLEHDYVFAGCNPCLLADLIVAAPEDTVHKIRKCLMPLQVGYTF